MPEWPGQEIEAHKAPPNLLSYQIERRVARLEKVTASKPKPKSRGVAKTGVATTGAVGAVAASDYLAQNIVEASQGYLTAAGAEFLVVGLVVAALVFVLLRWRAD